MVGADSFSAQSADRPKRIMHADEAGNHRNITDDDDPGLIIYRNAILRED
jgi:hypothetical protein